MRRTYSEVACYIDRSLPCLLPSALFDLGWGNRRPSLVGNIDRHSWLVSGRLANVGGCHFLFMLHRCLGCLGLNAIALMSVLPSFLPFSETCLNFKFLNLLVHFLTRSSVENSVADSIANLVTQLNLTPVLWLLRCLRRIITGADAHQMQYFRLQAWSSVTI